MSPRKGAEPPIATLVARLQSAPVAPMPEHEDWKEMLSRTAVSGRIAEVSEDVYWHFLEVLPPQYMGSGCFCFAEGAEPFRLFWQRGQQYFVRQLTWDETKAFCLSVGLPLDYWCY